MRMKLDGDLENWLYVFMDQECRSEETGILMEKIQLGYGEERHYPMDVINETHLRYFAFVNNLDKPAEEIYSLYKERQNIE